MSVEESADVELELSDEEYEEGSDSDDYESEEEDRGPCWGNPKHPGFVYFCATCLVTLTVGLTTLIASSSSLSVVVVSVLEWVIVSLVVIPLLYKLWKTHIFVQGMVAGYLVGCGVCILLSYYIVQYRDLSAASLYKIDNVTLPRTDYPNAGVLLFKPSVRVANPVDYGGFQQPSVTEATTCVAPLVPEESSTVDFSLGYTFWVVDRGCCFKDPTQTNATVTWQCWLDAAEPSAATLLAGKGGIAQLMTDDERKTAYAAVTAAYRAQGDSDALPDAKDIMYLSWERDPIETLEQYRLNAIITAITLVVAWPLAGLLMAVLTQ